MGKLISTFSFCLLTNLLYPQGFVSRIYLPHSQNMMTQAIYETTPGNYIGAGVSWDSINGQVISNLVMMGLNSAGQLTWTKKYAGFNVNTLALRCFYKRGNYLYRVGVGLDNNNKNFGTLLKIDLNGDTLWQRKYIDATDGCIPQMVTSSVDGGFLMTGFFEGINRTTLLIKTDANGNELWRKKIGKFIPNVSDGQSIVQDSLTKKIVITGYQRIINFGETDNVLITDSLGNNPIRSNFLTSIGGIAKDLIQLSTKEFIVVGIEDFPQSIGGNNLTKAYIAKFNLWSPNLLIWKVNFGRTLIYNGFGSVRETANGDISVIGWYDTLLVNNKAPNLLINKLIFNQNGLIKKQRYYDYKTNSDSLDNYISANSFELSSDGGSIVSLIRQNSPNPNPFMFVKYDANGCDSSTAHCATLNLVGENALKIDSEVLKIYPNPADEMINVECKMLNEDSQIKIINIIGEAIYDKKLSIQDSSDNVGINIQHLKSGIYFLQVWDKGNLIATKKIIKE